MLTDEELTVLLTDLESDRVERKQSHSDREKIREAICAFANDLPGHRAPGIIFVGVKDDGACAGLAVTDALLLTLSDMRTDGNILPIPSITVQKKDLKGCQLAVVIVEPTDAPPVRLRGRVWIRVGPRRALATPEEERRLSERRRSRDLPFDIQPVASCGLEALDIDLFERTYLPASVAPDILDANRRSREQQLTSLRMTSGATPTVLGLLTLGKDPAGFIPCAYVQFRRVDGFGLTDPDRDAVALSGPLPELIRALEERIESHIEVARDYRSGPVETAHPSYPLIALQQLVRNAILHRTYEGTNAPVRITWYSDRIEIVNPGGPYGYVNKSNFGQPDISDYRNPFLAEAMRNLGYIQRFGVGIAIAKAEMEGNGNPPIEFRVEDTHVVAILRRRL
jgi:ATP-dependent DNA helicase RecG